MLHDNFRKELTSNENDNEDSIVDFVDDENETNEE
jgi:hypothetical protein